MAARKSRSGGGGDAGAWVTLLSLLANASQASTVQAKDLENRNLRTHLVGATSTVKDLQARAARAEEAHRRLEEEHAKLLSRLRSVEAADADRKERFDRQSTLIAELQAENAALKAKIAGKGWKRSDA